MTLVESKAARREILEIRHSSLYAPRDFDISPYFEVVKPTIVRGFNYKAVAWADVQRPATEAIPAAVPAHDDRLSPVAWIAALLSAATRLNCAGMIDAAYKALSQMFAPPLRRVLLKAVGLALILIVFIGVLLYRLLAAWAETGANWAEQTAGMAPHAVWSALAWLLSIMAGLGIITGALFLMPAVSAFVGSFFVDEVGEAVEREHYPGEPVGHALPVLLAVVEGLKVALLALLVYLCALPFFLVAGLGVIMLFLANSYLLGREYFELAAMRFRPPDEAKAIRKANAIYLFVAGMVIAAFVSIPILNFATPVFAMAFMVHMHKKLSGSPAALVALPR